MPLHPWAGWGGCRGALGQGDPQPVEERMPTFTTPWRSHCMMVPSGAWDPHTSFSTSLLAPTRSFLRRLNANISSLYSSASPSTFPTGGAIATAQHLFYLWHSYLQCVCTLYPLDHSVWIFPSALGLFCVWEDTFCIDFLSVAKKS